MITVSKSPVNAASSFYNNDEDVLFVGDCLKLISKIPDAAIDLTVTSPPYCMGKDYENSHDVSDFLRHHEILLPEIVRITKPGGSICWQVGYHVKNAEVFPLDYAVFSVLAKIPDVKLRNRIIWTFGHGTHSRKRFSGRHETILWFTKGEDYYFDLDAVRVPQKYPGKRHYKGPKKGQWSGNPLGKNPSDIWEIPNVKANHIEKTTHPCQFPVALAQRLVRAFCPSHGCVFDPFTGAGSSGVAAILENRKFLGAELSAKYVKIAKMRLQETIEGNGQFRPLEKPLFEPRPTDAVSQRPPHFIGA